MKKQISFLVSVVSVIVLLSSNVFACACCADPGYYRLSVQKPDADHMRELTQLSFSGARPYATVGFPDDIRGVVPIHDDTYRVSATVGPSGWEFSFTDKDGKKGTLSLKMPKTFVDYGVDTHEKEKGGAGSVILYKEWRYKSKVRNATGIFASGKNGRPEFFLVLQGRGNACTSAGNFSHWRLEVTGKRANYAFYGSLKEESNDVSSSKSEMSSPSVPDSKRQLVVSRLVGRDFVGCGCSGWKKTDKPSQMLNPMFWSSFGSNGEADQLLMNIDSRNMMFRRVTKGARPEKEKVGDKFSDEYISDNTKVILDYRTKKLPCEGCEGTDYDVTATVIGEFAGKVLSLNGSCGC